MVSAEFTNKKTRAPARVFLCHPVALQLLPQSAVEWLTTLPLWSGTGVTAFFFLA
jgi:hypothetical protein